MREIWDNVWVKRELLDMSEIIISDSCYHLLKRLIGPIPATGLNILEVGCGSGINSLALIKKSRNYTPNSVSLVDFSSVALMFAKKNAEKNGINANYILADAFELPFPDESFDIVHNAGVNEHFTGERRQQIFNEMARVCKPGGQVIVIVPNALNVPYRIWKKIYEVQGKWEYGFEMPFTNSELRTKFKNAGLIPVKVSGEGTLASLSFLSRLIRYKNKDDNARASKPKNGSKIIKEARIIALKTDSLLGSTGGFTGAEIGMKAIKPDHI